MNRPSQQQLRFLFLVGVLYKSMLHLRFTDVFDGKHVLKFIKNLCPDIFFSNGTPANMTISYISLQANVASTHHCKYKFKYKYLGSKYKYKYLGYKYKYKYRKSRVVLEYKYKYQVLHLCRFRHSDTVQTRPNQVFACT